MPIPIQIDDGGRSGKKEVETIAVEVVERPGEFGGKRGESILASVEQAALGLLDLFACGSVKGAAPADHRALVAHPGQRENRLDQAEGVFGAPRFDTSRLEGVARRGA